MIIIIIMIMIIIIIIWFCSLYESSQKPHLSQIQFLKDANALLSFLRNLVHII